MRFMLLLSEKKCLPCHGGTLPLTVEQIQLYITEARGWKLVEEKKIRREYKFKDFSEAIEFTKQVASIAEEEGHHPDIHIFYNRVVLELWTHAIGGLSENDFILATKINTIST